MVTYSIIQKSQLEGAHRLDAEYYHPEKLEAMEKLSKFGVSTISENFRNIKEIFNPLRHKLATTPARIFDLSDVSSFLLEEGKEVTEANEIGSMKKIFRQNDVLISRLRPYLKEVSFAGFNDTQKLASTEFVVLRKRKDSKIPPQALFTFLMTDGVQKILFWSQGGTEHPRFSENLLMDLKLPKISEKAAESIVDNVNSAYKNYLTSRNLYSQAENLLLEELGLKNFEIEDDLSYIVNLSEVKSAHRADAEYFQPKYEKLESRIKNYESRRLNEIFTIRRGDFINPDYYVEKAKRGYIRIKELPAKGDINLDAITYIDDNFSGQNLETPQEGDFVFAGIGATLGKTARIPKELEGSFYSNNTARFRLKKEWEDKIDTYYLQVIFQSIICQWQFEQRQAQTAQAKIADEELKTVLIPILPRPTQQKIAEFVQKSHETRSKTKQLLEQAKQKVESLIEK